jgi:DNA-directed RNA polymerase-4/5 subunit 2
MSSECLGKPGYLGQNKVLPKSEFYNGQNAIVAVNVHLGYNQEDSLVMNRASLQRGMFRSEHIRSYKAEIENKESSDKRKKPEDIVNFGKIQSKIGRVDSLDEDGFPFVGANLQSGDIIIGRCADSGTDHSIKLKHTERGYVQKVVLSSNDEGKNFATVSLRQVTGGTKNYFNDNACCLWIIFYGLLHCTNLLNMGFILRFITEMNIGQTY